MHRVQELRECTEDTFTYLSKKELRPTNVYCLVMTNRAETVEKRTLIKTKVAQHAFK